MCRFMVQSHVMQKLGAYEIMERIDIMFCSIYLKCLLQIQVMGSNRLLSSQLLDESSSDDDEDFILSAAQIIHTVSQVRRKPGGSVPGRAYIYRDREAGHARLYQDYLADIPTYGPNLFRRR
jgi:hypothetical protein